MEMNRHNDNNDEYYEKQINRNSADYFEKNRYCYRCGMNMNFCLDRIEYSKKWIDYGLDV